MTAPHQSTIQVKERIFRSAARLFAGNGYARTGLRELAREADVNLALINYHYGSKKGLLKELLDRFFSGYLGVAEEELTGEGEPSAKLKRFIAAVVHYFHSHRELLLLTIAELPHDDEEIVDHKARWASRLMTIIDREICQPLARTTGVVVPAATLGPIFTSLIASRFLFSSVMERVGGNEQNILDVQGYTEIVTTFLLSGLETLSAPLFPPYPAQESHEKYAKTD